MGVGKILDVNVVANPGPVGGVVVGAEHLHERPPPQRGLARHLDELTGLQAAWAEAGLGLAAGDVEIAQDGVAHGGHCAEIAQHPFRHQLGSAIGIVGRGRTLFGGWEMQGRQGIDRGGGREHEMLDTGPGAGREQGVHEAGIGVVVLKRKTDRIRDAGSGGEVEHRIDGMATQ